MTEIPKHPHLVKRQQQRGLKNEVLQFIVHFGDIEFGAGAIWYIVREKSLPSYLQGTKIAERAKRWVVMALKREGHGEILTTAYAKRGASRHVRHKSWQPSQERRRIRLRSNRV